MLRLANKDDYIEDMYLAIRELVEHHQCQPREIRRFVNQALRGTPPKLISNRLNFAQNGSGGEERVLRADSVAARAGESASVCPTSSPPPSTSRS
jgi:hypothetical protein